jgi:hypothetical protein
MVLQSIAVAGEEKTGLYGLKEGMTVEQVEKVLGRKVIAADGEPCMYVCRPVAINFFSGVRRRTHVMGVYIHPKLGLFKIDEFEPRLKAGDSDDATYLTEVYVRLVVVWGTMAVDDCYQVITSPAKWEAIDSEFGTVHTSWLSKDHEKSLKGKPLADKLSDKVQKAGLSLVKLLISADPTTGQVVVVTEHWFPNGDAAEALIAEEAKNKEK